MRKSSVTNCKSHKLLSYNSNSRNVLNKTDAKTLVQQTFEKSKNVKRNLNISDQLYQDSEKRRKSKKLRS